MKRNKIKLISTALIIKCFDLALLADKAWHGCKTFNHDITFVFGGDTKLKSMSFR